MLQAARRRRRMRDRRKKVACLSLAIVASMLFAGFPQSAYADPGEIAYDDGSHEDYLQGTVWRGVHFSTTRTTLEEIKFYDAGANAEQVFWKVMEWDVGTGQPGSVIAEDYKYGIAGSDYWYIVPVGPVSVPKEFFVAFQIQFYATFTPGVDTDGPPHGRSYYESAGVWKKETRYGSSNYMIRAVMGPATNDDIMSEVVNIENKLDPGGAFHEFVSGFLTDIQANLMELAAGVGEDLPHIRARLDDEGYFTDDLELSAARDALSAEIDENEARLEAMTGELLSPDHGLEEIKREVRLIEEGLETVTLGIDVNEAKIDEIESRLDDPEHGLEEIKNEIRDIEEKLEASAVDALDVEIVSIYKDDVGQANDKKGFLVVISHGGTRVDYDDVAVYAEGKELSSPEDYTLTPIMTGTYRLEVDKKALEKKPDTQALVIDVRASVDSVDYYGTGVSAIKH